jgi:hypothetical protein
MQLKQSFPRKLLLIRATFSNLGISHDIELEILPLDASNSVAMMVSLA